MLNLVPFMGKKVKIIITTGSQLDTLEGVLMHNSKYGSCYMDFDNYRIWINPDYVVTIREELA